MICHDMAKISIVSSTGATLPNRRTTVERELRLWDQISLITADASGLNGFFLAASEYR